MYSKLLFSFFMVGLLSFSAEARRDQNRETRQQGRISQGVQSGELNRAEAHRLRRAQKRVDRAQASAQADGMMTDAEKAHLEKMQDVQSKRIYQQKHDEQQRADQNP
ncbi:MAG: hypothetical protein ACXWC9_09190 [Pseudobdellovibrionaceae bacterium]